MPFIVSRVNIPVSIEKKIKIKEAYGNLIELIPGKSEERVVLVQEDNLCIAAAGNMEAPAAFIEVNLFKSRDHENFSLFSKEITRVYQKELGINPARVYIKFMDMPGIAKNGIYQDEKE